MEERRVADYFVVAGLPSNPEPLEEFSNEAAIKSTHKLDPITDIAVINKTLGEKIPNGFVCIDQTPTGFNADLNHGSIRCPEMYLCVRRGRDRRPLSNIGVVYDGKERVMEDCEIIMTTPQNHSANINNTNSSRTYITYRRCGDTVANDTLAVVDICIILANKGEMPPHAYCQINKNLNKAMVGSDIFLCYKKSMIKTDLLAYKPAILSRYPANDYDGFPLPDSVPLFCLPMGATLETRPGHMAYLQPLFSTFILTLSDGDKIYGAAIAFYEQYDDSRLSDAQLRHLGMKNKQIRDQYNITTVVHSKKCICLLSHWPLFEAFKKFLFYLYSISLSGPHSIPIERHISHFMFEVPFPSPQRPRILIQLHDQAICLAMPEESPIPQGGASFLSLVRDLGPENCMNMIFFLLTEQKILLHSLRPAVLTGVAEAVAAIIFPFRWQCPYIPLCPIGLAGVLNAPCPFIVGIDSRYFDLYDPPSDVICIDLDTNTVWLPDEKKHLSWKSLPKKPVRVLQDSLTKLYTRIGEQQESLREHQEVTLAMPAIDFDFQRKRAETVLELSTQDVFLRFMACLMKGYKQFLKPIEQAPTSDATAATSLFDMHGFFKSRDKSFSRFFSQFMKTQLFIRFIEERSFVSDRDASLAFFDDCTEKVEEAKDEPRLIELDESYRSERTVFVMPPEPTGLPEGATYAYSEFPSLREELFLQRNASSLSLNKQPQCPNSPVARRTKQEMKSAQKAAHEQVATPSEWAKCLLGNCYSLWFIHLPSFVLYSKSKLKALTLAYDVLIKMQDEDLKLIDEICYRVVLQLCGQYNQPVLAVKVLSEMKKTGLHPNAITYGFYNKAVFESKWPAALSRGLVLWTKLRNVVLGAARFKRFVRLAEHGTVTSGSDGASIDSCVDEVDQKSSRDGYTTTRGTTGEARASIGSSSDRGYSSLSNDDAWAMSTLIKRADAVGDPHNGMTGENQPQHRLYKRTQSEGYKWRRPGMLSRAMTIVRTSAVANDDAIPTDDGSTDKTHTSSIVGSAGLLMVSQSLLDEKIFSRVYESVGQLRHRHRSTSDGDGDAETLQSPSSRDSNKPTSLTLNIHDGKQRKFDSVSEDTVLTQNNLNVTPEKFDENADSGVCLNETGQGDVESSRTSEQCHDGSLMNLSDSGKNFGLYSNSENLLDDALSEVKPCDILEFNPMVYDPLTPTGDRSGSFKEAVPVTQCDPLGAFQPDPVISLSRSDTSPLLTQPFLSSPEKSLTVFNEGLFTSDDDNVSKSDLSVDSNAESQTSTKSEMYKNTSDLLDSTQKPLERSSSLVPQSVEAAVKGFGRWIYLGRAISTPDGLSSPVKSPFWRSAMRLVKAGSADGTTIPKKGGMKDYALQRTQSLRRSKDQIEAAVKSATKTMATRLTNTWTQYMTTPEKVLQHSEATEFSDSDIDKNETDDEVRALRHGFGSSDAASRESDESLGDRASSISEGRLAASNAKHVAFESDDAGQSIEEQFRALDQYEDKTGTLRSLAETMMDIAAEVEISSCCRCPHCQSLLYDEEIMTGWSPDNSNLNTRCIFCNTKLVPHLQVYVKDWRHRQQQVNDTDLRSEDFPYVRSSPNRKSPLHNPGGTFHDDIDQALSTTSNDSNSYLMDDQIGKPSNMQTDSPLPTKPHPHCSTPTTDSSLPTSPEAVPEMKKTSFTKELSNVSPTIVPYLSPLVLRKELENILVSEGDVTLTSDEFVDNHPIIYWNMVWYFKRINVPSHLPTFTLTAKTMKYSTPAVNSTFTHRNILVRPLWDNVRIHNEFSIPMYLSWTNDATEEDKGDKALRELMENTISEIKVNDMLTPITRVIAARRKLGGRSRHFHSIYREILFLAITACSRENIDNDAFDREYKKAMGKLSPSDSRALQPDDSPRPLKAAWCRKLFEQLEV